MNNKIYRVAIVLLLIFGAIGVKNNEFHADPVFQYQAIRDQSGEDYAINNLIGLYQDGRYTTGDVQEIIDHEYKWGRISDESISKLQSAGIPVSAPGSSNASPSLAQTSQPTTQPAAKTEFTVTDVTPYPAWATQDCNIRSGADTTYDKSGSLKIHEKVTVTGNASTGWFRIITEAGQEAYVSNTLLTTEDPNSVSFSTVDDEGVVTDFTVEGENAEAVAEVVEKIKDGTLVGGVEVEKEEPEVHEHSYTSEVVTEATCTQTGTMKFTCECGDTYVEDIPMTEHTPGEWAVAKSATLTSPGLEELACTKCGTVIESREIPANSKLLYGIIGGVVLVILIMVVVIKLKNKGVE